MVIEGSAYNVCYNEVSEVRCVRLYISQVPNGDPRSVILVRWNAMSNCQLNTMG